MAGRRKAQVLPNDETLNEAYWLRFSEQSEPSVRNKLLYVSMDEIAKVGPAEFNGVKVCHRLAVSASLINHYFAGRDGLIAEATAESYKRYIEMLRDAAAAHPTDPAEALRAWMLAQITWGRESPGLAAILNYSSAFPNISELIHRDFQKEITEYFEYNMALVILLIRSIRDETPFVVPQIEGPLSASLRATLLADEVSVQLATSIAWSALGAAVWAGGQHTPSSGTRETAKRDKAMIGAHLDHTISALRKF